MVGRVIRVVDGDTIDVFLDSGVTDRVRLLGIDTPEISSANKRGEYGDITDIECLGAWGSTAHEMMDELVGGAEVTLLLDRTAGRRGSFGRLLAYVLIDDIDINALLVSAGLARVYTEGTSVREREYVALQNAAMGDGVGLWSCGRGTDSNIRTQSDTEDGNGCDPSYPSVCIPSPPPDLDCGEIQFRRFRVTGRDPHRFDGDKDGIGCES